MFLKKKSIYNNYISLELGKKEKTNIKLFPLATNSFHKKRNNDDKDIFIFNSLSKESKKNNDISHFSNGSSCPLGNKCPYFLKYTKVKNELIVLLSSITKIKNFNQSLLNSLSKRSNLYYSVISENEGLKKILNKLTNKKGAFDIPLNENNKNFENSLAKHKSLSNIKKYRNLSLYESNNRNEKEMTKNSKSIINHKLPNKTFSSRKLNSDIFSNTNSNNNFLINNRQLSNIEISHNKNIIIQNGALRTNILSENKNRDPKKHYEIIYNFSKHQNQRLVGGDNLKYSFLSPNMDYNTITSNNDTLKKLEQLTKSDENFLRIMSDSPNESLLKYSDMIISLINDYKDIIKIGIKMKNFIYSSNKLIDSIIDDEPSKILIENTCSILNCDRASLFLLDKVSDSLIVSTGEGIKKAQIRVPKDKGIVGACFLEKRKVRIDDAYLDKRFNKEVDKKTNYRTRSILCYPMINNEGECIGVIEAINKLIGLFNDDDEELLKILSYQACIIYRNLSSYDDNKFMVLKMNIIMNYSIEISKIKNKFDFTEKTEDALLNLFSCVNSAFYFVEDNKLKRYKEDKVQTFNINLGVIGKSIQEKEILAYQSIKNCAEFNNLIDIKSLDGLLTFPILERKTKNVKGVVQVPYIGKVYENGKPSEKEIKILKKFRKCIKYWIEINFIENEKKEDLVL